MTKMVEHHTHYKEIHGHDETVWMTKSEHGKLHYRLRKEEKCNISVNDLSIISKAASHRTDKYKEYRKTPPIKQYNTKYSKRNIFYYRFFESMKRYVSYREQIRYNIKTGSVGVTCGFTGNNNKKLYYIDTN